MIDPPEDSGDQNDGSNARVDGASYEVGAKDRRVPHRLCLHSKDPGHNCVDTYRNRNNGNAKEDAHLVKNSLLPFRSCPTEREGSIKPVPPWKAISQKGDIGYHEHIEEENAGDEIGHDAREIPEKRGDEVSMKGYPVELHGAAQVKKNVRRTGCEGKDGYHLGSPRDRSSPSCMGDS